MADLKAAITGLRSVFSSVARHPLTLWTAFLLVHLWLGHINQHSTQSPMGDVTWVYKFWVEQYVVEGFRVGIDSQWVYPILAFPPMQLAYIFGPNPYGATWLSMILILDLVALGVLTGWGKRRDNFEAAWWWTLFLFILGPIALGRIDSVTVPVAMVGMLLLASRPRAAGIVLAVATWIKVWPAALLAAVLIASRDRLRVLIAIGATTLAVVAVVVVLGGGANVLSFVSQQAGRGLQVEAPVSTLWMWIALADPNSAFVYFSREILTYQVTGFGTDLAAAAMTPLLGVVVAVLAWLGIRAVRRGAAVERLLPTLALAFVTAFIVFNKVGSPQFESWLAVPVVVGLLAASRGGQSFRTPALVAIVIALLTQLIYPTFYELVLALDPVMLVILTVRNLLLIGLLAWAVAAVARVGAPDHAAQGMDTADGTPASTWPLAKPRS